MSGNQRRSGSEQAPLGSRSIHRGNELRRDVHLILAGIACGFSVNRHAEHFSDGIRDNPPDLHLRTNRRLLNRRRHRTFCTTFVQSIWHSMRSGNQQLACHQVRCAGSTPPPPPSLICLLSYTYKFLDEVDLDALLLFRDTWIDGPLAKRKKQERLVGFFWACVRRGYITENPTFGLGKIKVDQTPTDYFPPHEFEEIVDATYAYRENRGETGNSNGTRLCTMTLLMRWSGLRIRMR